MKPVPLALIALCLTACNGKPEATQAPAAPEQPADVSSSPAYTQDRAKALSAIRQLLPGLDATPAQFTVEWLHLGQCTATASAELSVRLCGQGDGVSNLLITGRKPGLDIGPSVRAAAAVIAPGAAADDVSRVVAEAQSAISAGETAKVCPAARCFQVVPLGATWIVSANASTAP